MNPDLDPVFPNHRKLSGFVDIYIQKKLTRVGHPAFKAIRDEEEDNKAAEEERQGVLTRKDDERQVEDSGLSLEEIYQDAETEKRQFELAMQEYERTADAKFKTGISCSSIHTWEEVLEEVNKAAEQYKNVPGLWGKVKRAFRRFGKNNKAFTAWSCLLPSQSEYFSILCGGVKLIIGAAARMHDLRQDICDALAEIPILLKSTNRALTIFKPSKDLKECSSALYVATIAALHHMLWWYKEKAYKKLTKSLFKQDSYGADLKEKIKDIRERSKQFDKSAQLCLFELSLNTSEELKAHRREASANREIITEQVHEMGKNVVWEILNRFLESSPQNDPVAYNLRRPILLRKALSEDSLIRKAKAKLLQDFDYESSVIQQDIDTALRGIWTLPKPDQDRVVTIMRSHKLQQWITEPSSSGLFINANGKSNMRQRSSFTSAKLVDSIQPPTTRGRNRSICALSFFCGEHRRRNDPDSGVDGMMRSLISQLLLAYPDFEISTMRALRNYEYDNVEDLCEILDILILELPRHMVIFCIIDSISFFEEDRMKREESELVVEVLMDIVESTQDYGCTFKVLLTSPWNSRVLYKQMISQQRDVLWVPRNVPSQGGFTSMKWSDGIGSDLGSLSLR